MSEECHTDRPLADVAEAAIHYHASGDHMDRGVGCECGTDAAMALMRHYGRRVEVPHLTECPIVAEYWSDEDKRAVEEIASDLVDYVTQAMVRRGWRQR